MTRRIDYMNMKLRLSEMLFHPCHICTLVNNLDYKVRSFMATASIFVQRPLWIIELFDRLFLFALIGWKFGLATSRYKCDDYLWKIDRAGNGLCNDLGCHLRYRLITALIIHLFQFWNTQAITIQYFSIMSRIFIKVCFIPQCTTFRSLINMHIKNTRHWIYVAD